MNRSILGALVGIIMISGAFARYYLWVVWTQMVMLYQANVVVEGTTLGAAATLSGGYSISVPDGSYKQCCSVVGYNQVLL